MCEVRQSAKQSPNQSNDWLPRALRELGATSEQHAPPRVGAALKEAFARRHTARRRAQRLRRAAMAASLLLAGAITLLPRGPRAGSLMPGSPAAGPDQISPPAVTAHLGTALTVTAPPDTEHSASRPRPQPAADGPADRPFVALPAYDSHLNHEELRVVRLQLPGEALRRVGVPVQEEHAERLVLADFVVGQDGTPYAFRLVLP